MLKKEAERITGGLSKLLARCQKAAITCQRAPARLARSSGRSPTRPAINATPLRVRYNFPNVKDALARRRLKSLDHPQWVEAMTTLVKKEESILDGTIQGTCKASRISRKFLKYAKTHQGPCTGCRLRSVDTCRWAHILKI